MTMGDLSRRFERDRVFARGEYAVGPAVTSYGASNDDLRLRFGTFGGARRPKAIELPSGFVVLTGGYARLWCELSTGELRSVLRCRRVVLARRHRSL